MENGYLGQFDLTASFSVRSFLDCDALIGIHDYITTVNESSTLHQFYKYVWSDIFGNYGYVPPAWAIDHWVAYFEHDVVAKLPRHSGDVLHGQYAPLYSTKMCVLGSLPEFGYEEYLPFIWIYGKEKYLEPMTFDKHVARLLKNTSFSLGITNILSNLDRSMSDVFEALRKEAYIQNEQMQHERKNWKRN